jgi:hypothetical protein
LLKNLEPKNKNNSARNTEEILQEVRKG